MTAERLLTFEIKRQRFEWGKRRETRDEPVLNISVDPVGIGEMVGWLTALKQANESPARLTWRTPANGGHELTTETQRNDTAIVHDVRVSLWHDTNPAPDEKLLTFEIMPDGQQVQIHCDPPGLNHLISMLTRLSNTKHPIDHDHWMTENWAGHELTEQKRGEETVLVNIVNVYFDR